MPPRIFDISRTMQASMAVWPGDTPFDLHVELDTGQGDPVTVSRLTLSSHTGTHIDAPRHFLHDDLPVDQLPLEPYIGPATVVTVSREHGPLTPADFPGLDWSRVRRLLVHSPASDLPPEQFPPRYVYPSPELADHLGRYGVVLFGSDAPSMDEVDSKTLPGHKALRRNGIAILEGLRFQDVPDGEYELVALPLKIARGDGSPVRAVLLARRPEA